MMSPMSSDSEKERQRLAELYATMPSEQLQKIASESDELTEVARAQLDSEITRRGLLALDSPLQEETPAVKPDSSPGAKLVMVRRYRDLPEALLAKGSLDSAGIESFLADDNMVRMDWFWSNLIGGIKLLVSPEDVNDANAIFDQPTPESFEVSDGSYQQPRCSQCGSLDISFEELNKPIAYLSASLAIPLPIHNQGWTCHACKHHWKGSGEESSGTE